MAPSAQQLALFEQGQPLVRSIALAILRRLPLRVELEDLIGYGQVGLAEAVMRYEENRSIQFTTFAYYRIKGAIFDGVSKMSWTSRGRLQRLRFGQGKEPGRESAGDEQRHSAFEQLARVFVTSQYERGSDVAGDEVLEDTTWSPLMAAANREIAVKLHSLVKALPRLPRVLIESIYFEGTTLQDAAKRLGISKSWASRLHAQTLQQLSLSLRQLGLD